jgi:GT2 family glycosyltransferase
MIDLSVLIINWNTRDYLVNCLRSLMQTEGSPWEIIVVDNGSPDGSGVEVKRLFPAVRLIENDSNLGFAKAVNQGLRVFSGRYALLLNPDTQVKEGSVEKLLSFMEAHPKAGAAGGQLLNSDGSKQNSIANFPSLATELLNKRVLRRLAPKRFPGKERPYAEAIEVDSVIGACMMVRREAMEEVGLLDEDYFLFLEETDWCFRMRKAGWRVYYIPQAEIIHFQGKSAETEKGKARIEYYRSRYHYFRKNRGDFRSSVLFIGLIIKLSVELAFGTMACVLTLFMVKRWRTKLSTYLYLMWWHLRLCPQEMGLRPTKDKLQIGF